MNVDHYQTQKTCIECSNPKLIKDKDECITYCPRCGLVHQASIMYVGGNKIDLPYGLYK